jgi:hypothetical protein
VNWELEKSLVVSTAHMTNHDDILLSRAAVKSWDKYDYGYRICLCKEDGEILEQDTEFEKLGFSAAFLNLLRTARRLGCDGLKLDQDGPVYENLIQFTW